jgi:type IV fimbrial biogenesis protein FimT
MRRLNRGLTLIELMIALAISAVLAVAAAPFLGDYVANSRLREGGNTLLAQTLLAQSEARSRNVPMRLSVAGNSLRLLDLSDPNAVVVVREQTLANSLVAAVDTNIDFGSDGRLTPLQDVGVNLVMSNSTCSADRRCPGLRVDAGGAIRLCGDITQSCN